MENMKMGDVFEVAARNHCDSSIQDAWKEFERTGEISNSAELILNAAEFYQEYAASSDNHTAQHVERVKELEDKCTTLLQCLYEIQSECIGELAMGYRLDAESIGSSITQTTGLTHPELLKLLEQSK